MKKKHLRLRILLASLLSVYVCTSCSLSHVKVVASNDVKARAECVMELNSRRVLYEAHGDIRLPMASTTKILTAATVLDNVSNLQEEIQIPNGIDFMELKGLRIEAREKLNKIPLTF